MVEIGKRGRIQNGEYAGWDIIIEDDAENTGGYLVLISAGHGKPREGYDDWVETKDDLGKYMEESGWIVDWQPSDSI